MATRGTAFLVTDKYVLETLEFNGDMYRDGCGQEMINMLHETKNVNQFKEAIDSFNKENHNYKGFDLSTLRVRDNYIEENTRGEDIVKMTDKNYFDIYFSDWTFWKNLSSKDITFKTREGASILLKKGEVVSICFGKKAGHYFGSDKVDCDKLLEIQHS